MAGRTGYQKGTDRARGAEIEDMVGEWLGHWKISHTNSTDRLDFYVPGAYVEVKTKNQPIAKHWPLPCEEQDALILDELSLRKAMAHYPLAYFMFYDRPLDRWFLARVDEVACAERVRVNREGHGGHLKGKLLLDLRQFRQLLDPENDLLPTILKDQVETPWKVSHCISNLEVPQL